MAQGGDDEPTDPGVVELVPRAVPPPIPRSSRPSAFPIHTSSVPPKAATFPPKASPWRSSVERLGREVDARAASEPSRAALLLAAQARVCIDGLGDPLRAASALTRAEELAPGARFVAATWRWLAEQGADPLAVLARTKGELTHVGEGPERTALLWHAASLEGHVIGDLESAKQTTRELLALDPNDLGGWDALAALHLRSRSEAEEWDDAPGSDDAVFGGVVESLEVMARATEDLPTRGALLGAAGALRDRFLEDATGALAALHRSVEADGGNDAACATLESILLRQRAWDEYARVVALRADKSRDPRVAAEAYERAGDVYAECVGDHGLAAQCFVRAATMNESDPSPVDKLVIVLETSGRWADAAAAYDKLLPRIHEPTEKAWALVRLASLHETRLDRPDDALATYRLAVDASPTFAPAVQGLLRLARARGLTPVVVELERREAERVADPYVRAVRLAALAEFVEASKGPKRLEEATTLYERALTLDSTNACAFDALERIYRGGAQWPRLIALYEAALATTGDRRRARALRIELAELVHSRLQQPARAAELLREALTGPEDHFPTLLALARALESAGRWTEYVETLEAQASVLTGGDEVAAVHRIASALETRVKDRARALATYEIVVDRAPRHETAIRAIVRIHEQEARYESVIAATRRLIDLATRPEDVLEGLLRIARIAEEQLGRVDEAVALYTEALKQTPSCAPAIAALEKLLRGTGDFRRLAQALRSFADATTDRRAKVRAMMRAATVLELCLDDTDSASAVYGRAVTAAGPLGSGLDAEYHAALWGLLRLQETRGEWDGVDRTLGELLAMTSEASSRLRLLVRLARNAELHLADMPRAAALYDEAAGAGAPPATLAVDRLRVARVHGDHEAISRHLAAMAASTTDPRLAEGLLRELALMTEPRSPQQAVAIYERLLARTPDEPLVLEGLVRCGASPTPARFLSQALLARARTTSDPAQRALVALGAGAIDEAAGRTDDAAAAFAFALQAEPDLLPALAAAKRLRLQAGDFRAAAALAERSARASVDGENVAQTWVEAAEIHESRLDDGPRALICLRSLLTHQPGHRPALEKALELLEGSFEWDVAASLLLAHVEAITEPSTRARCLTQRAALLASRLGDTPGAILDLRRAMTLRPDDEDITTMEVLAALEERTKNWQDALQLHGRVARAAVDATVRRRARLAEARIVAEELRDHANAKAILEDLAKDLPDDRDVSLRLANAAARAGDDARALDLYAELSESGPTVERARALIAVSDLKRSRPEAWPAADGDAALVRAFDLAIAEPAAIGLLEEHAARDGDFRPFTTHAEAAIGRVPPNTPGILPMRTALARAMREQLGNPTGADRHLAAAIKAFPTSMPTRLALAAGLRGRNDEAALAELRGAVEADPTADEPFAALVTLAVATGRPAIGAMLASAAAFLGASGEEIEAALTEAAPLRPLPDALLFEEAMGRLVGPSRAWYVRSLLAVLDPFLPKIFPANEAVVDPGSRLPDSLLLVSDVRAIAAALGIVSPPMYRSAGRDVAVVFTEPRAIVVGADWLPDAVRPVALFHCAYACARIAGYGSVYAAPRPHVASLLDAAAKPDSDGALVRDFRKRIASALPRKNKKDLERIVAAAGAADVRIELPLWEAEESRRALFVAALLSRDMRAIGQVLAADAVALSGGERRRAVASNRTLRELLEFFVSAPCWEAFKRLYGRS